MEIQKKQQQIEFSSVLFDTLFGLVLFFSLDSFLDIKNPLHFIFYLFSLIIVIHWWLIFKAADDAFDKEVVDSGLDLIIGIIQLIFIQYIVLMARSFNYTAAGWYLVALLFIDLIWAIIWRYCGKWRTQDELKIKEMELELDNNLKITSIGIITFVLLVVLAQFILPLVYVIWFIMLYLIFIIFTFRYKIIDIKSF